MGKSLLSMGLQLPSLYVYENGCPPEIHLSYQPSLGGAVNVQQSVTMTIKFDSLTGQGGLFYRRGIAYLSRIAPIFRIMLVFTVKVLSFFFVSDGHG